MRRCGLVVVIAAVSANAAPVPPQLSWADWVGDWSGKLEWAGCTIDGEPKATVSFDAADGALAIDLAPAGGAH